MCFGGGDKATKQAEKAEAARQSTISGNVGAINTAFRGREPQYAEVGNATRSRLNTELARKRSEASRQTKFALAKSGLSGGSAAIDAGRRLTREGQEGAIGVERMARATEADLRSQDEASRLQLISLAQSGSEIGNAGQQAANMLRSNIDSAANKNLVDGLGNVFGGSADAYKRSQDAAARRKGLSEASTYAKAFSR